MAVDEAVHEQPTWRENVFASLVAKQQAALEAPGVVMLSPEDDDEAEEASEVRVLSPSPEPVTHTLPPKTLTGKGQAWRKMQEAVSGAASASVISAFVPAPAPSPAPSNSSAGMKKKKKTKKKREFPTEEELGFQRQTGAEMTKLPSKGIPGDFVPLADESHAVFQAVPAALKPREEQRKAAARLLSHNMLAVWQVGTGKTLLAVLGIKLLLVEGVVTKAVVCVPAKLQDNFLDTLRAVGIPPGMRDRITVSTHTSFYNKYKDMLSMKEEERAEAGALLEADMQDAMLVVDEAHEFRTVCKPHKGEGLRSFVYLKAASLCRRVLLLTATPIVNHPSDIANLVAMVRGEFHPVCATGLESLQRTLPDGKIGYTEGYRRSLIRTLFGGLVSFVDQNSKHYPTVTEEIVNIKMAREEQLSLQAAELEQEDALERLGVLRSGGMAQFHFGARVTANRAGADGEEVISKKAAKVVDLLKDRPGKAIVYSNYIGNGQHIIREAFLRAELTHVFIDGAIGEDDFRAAKEAFAAGEVSVLIISSAGAQGLDFKGVKTVIIFEPAWNRPRLEQAIGRAVRYKSHSHLPPDQRHVQVYHLHMKKDEHLALACGAQIETGDDILASITAKKLTNTEEFIADLRSVAVKVV